MLVNNSVSSLDILNKIRSIKLFLLFPTFLVSLSSYEKVQLILDCLSIAQSLQEVKI